MKNLDNIFPSEFVQKREQQYELDELKKKKATYWDFLGELGFFLGFEAVRAVLDNYLTIEQANTLLQGCRRVHSGVIYDHAHASLAGAAGIHKAAYFDRVMASYKKDMIR